MTELDFATFATAFARMLSAYRVKLKPVQADELARTYYRVLDAYELDAVLAAGRACLGRCKRFPVVADWLDALGPATHAPAPQDARQMSATEVDEQEHAARLGYNDEPCACMPCVRAGVSARSLRFVPTELPDGYERAFNARSGRVELVGHWAHGAELARWYVARDKFFASSKGAPAPLARVLALVGVVEGVIVGEREPGMEG